MKRTELGKFLKKLRIDNDEVIKDMAKKLGVSDSYLSQIELGNRKIPKAFLSRILEAYELNTEQINKLSKIIYKNETVDTTKCKDCKHYSEYDLYTNICKLDMKTVFPNNNRCKKFKPKTTGAEDNE